MKPKNKGCRGMMLNVRNIEKSRKKGGIRTHHLTKTQNLCDQIAKFIVSRDLEELKDLHCGMLAEKYDLTQPYLVRIFRECINIPLREFIKQIKLLRCALLMRENRYLTVKQIAEKCGFEDIEYFRKSFKKFYGITPAKFIKFRKK
jgi:AraC-like DNA-binding protein